MPEQTVKLLLTKMNELSSEKYKENVVKLGIPAENSLGVSTSDLRKMIASIPKAERTSQLTEALWQTGFHEAKILAVLVGSYCYNDFSEQAIHSMMTEIYSWDLCDLFCKSILIKRKDFDKWIEIFLNSESLYTKRAGFTLLAAMSTHASLSEEQVSYYLSLIPKFSNDERLHLKKAASWALRELGKIDESAKEKSISLANDLLNAQSKAHQWIAKDALKELNTLIRVEGRSRLISANTKMGKAALK
ncbi:3-methyladenine DNA glycosylase AlkD [Enterococcus sp. PF1-24]|uniref:DNA alkylation repair protein n=1 Tax=unclassified Enterococcus TaxID=2608891 RepID=UPI0024760591|nr:MULTISPECIES: DNA alkylation repair protein [unclassified Enterococcus]MDH6365421.1 3-methyladenine DNA glycosylase AlkD [Enterococcus sp. PFB1-1]MDH6402507.1 3-methyladenine DNA glycosylase AlkD [Enterococcus sp. PF1-24]